MTKTDVHTLSQDERLVRPSVNGRRSPDGVASFSDIPEARDLDVSGEVKFVNDMLQQYVQSDDPALKPFQEIKSRVFERQKESRLFLGVVGEFSSGKSTLVNALIRQELLRTDVLQGTTAAATVLYYGDTLDVKVRRREKGLITRVTQSILRGAKALSSLFSSPPPAPTRDELLQLIHQATSDEEFAKDIVQVDVRTPSDSLKDGLVVVDTPGANAANPRHSPITAAALRDICDAALVVVPAEAAGSESLFRFLKTHAADVVHRCVFVVTKIDLIRREKERERVLQTLRARITQELDVAKPRVLACAPQFVVEQLNPNRNGANEFSSDEIQYWGEHFISMEVELKVLLLQKRLQAQVDDVAKLVMQLLVQLRELLQQRLDGYRERHRALENVVIPNVAQFIEERVNRHCGVCRRDTDKIERESEREFSSVAQEIHAEIANAISSADSRSALRTAVETAIPRIYSKGQDRLQRLLHGTIKDMSGVASTELKKFHNEFQEHYRALATLGGALNIDRVNTHAVAQSFSATGREVNQSIANDLKSLDQQQILGKMGMVGAGALIGSVVPVIGTAVGALVGGALSLLFGPSLGELKSQVWERLEPEIRGGIQSFAHSADSAVDATKDAVLKELRASITSYLPRYQGLVQKMLDRDAEEKKQLEAFQVRIEGDLAKIESRQKSLEQLRIRFRDL